MNEKAKILMNNAMHRLMLSCDTATFFITKKEYQKLSCKENFQLKMHLMGCKFCRAFNEQNAILSDKIHTLQQNPTPAELSPEKKVEIKKVLDKQ